MRQGQRVIYSIAEHPDHTISRLQESHFFEFALWERLVFDVSDANQPADALGSPHIAPLTGITQEAIDREGRPLAEAMNAFVAFAGSRPVFFHNAPFDTRFLKAAASTTGVKFANAVHDTLPMARAAWPTLGSYKLSLLAEHVGTPAPTHRALADVRTTLAILLAARRKELAAA